MRSIHNHRIDEITGQLPNYPKGAEKNLMTQTGLTGLDSDNRSPMLKLDDGTGLRVAKATFESQFPFDWSLFTGYDTIKILTYSAGTSAVVRMLENHGFQDFQCVFGSEQTLNTFQDILAFQKLATSDARAAILNLSDDRHAFILDRVRQGQARFWVLRKKIAHAKIYLLEDIASGNTRTIVGSANLSETAFGGRQTETLICFDNDPKAWDHYMGIYESIRDQSSDQIDLPEDRIHKAEISITEVPVLNPNNKSTLILDTSDRSLQNGNTIHFDVPTQIERIERIKRTEIPPVIATIIPAVKRNKQEITHELRQRIIRETSRIRLVDTTEEANHNEMSIDRTNKTVSIKGEPLNLTTDPQELRQDVDLMVDFFSNYEGRFEGGMGVPRLQKDYFILWSWLYFSPFMCDMRIKAAHDGDIFRCPSFAIVYGKPSCGKSRVIDAIITSMFGRAHNVDKEDFTKTKIRDIQNAYKRFPVVFDDIGKKAIRDHGEDVIKRDTPLTASEHPCFILSMNQDLKAFTDQIVKRSLMIYTTTALPSYKESLRHELHMKVVKITESLSTNLYREYLKRILDKFDETPHPEDWLEFSSTTLTDLIIENSTSKIPTWCKPVQWYEYADTRHERVKGQLDHLLRPSGKIKKEGTKSNGWILEKDKVIIVEQTDTFGRREFDWVNVPSTLIDDSASVGGRTVLNRRELEEFLGRHLAKGTKSLLSRIRLGA